jgi:hypothetical protein
VRILGCLPASTSATRVGPDVAKKGFWGIFNTGGGEMLLGLDSQCNGQVVATP